MDHTQFRAGLDVRPCDSSFPGPCTGVFFGISGAKNCRFCASIADVPVLPYVKRPGGSEGLSLRPDSGNDMSIPLSPQRIG